MPSDQWQTLDSSGRLESSRNGLGLESPASARHTPGRDFHGLPRNGSSYACEAGVDGWVAGLQVLLC